MIGGEDAVFYRQARGPGLTIRFAAGCSGRRTHAAIERTSYGYQLRRFLWHGNSSYVTAVQGGLSTPNRMLLAG